jgi:hypothetical protein
MVIHSKKYHTTLKAVVKSKEDSKWKWGVGEDLGSMLEAIFGDSDLVIKKTVVANTSQTIFKPFK